MCYCWVGNVTCVQHVLDILVFLHQYLANLWSVDTRIFVETNYRCVSVTVYCNCWLFYFIFIFDAGGCATGVLIDISDNSASVVSKKAADVTSVSSDELGCCIGESRGTVSFIFQQQRKPIKSDKIITFIWTVKFAMVNTCKPNNYHLIIKYMFFFLATTASILHTFNALYSLCICWPNSCSGFYIFIIYWTFWVNYNTLKVY